jgi:hypothetical protein
VTVEDRGIVGSVGRIEDRLYALELSVDELSAKMRSVCRPEITGVSQMHYENAERKPDLELSAMANSLNHFEAMLITIHGKLNNLYQRIDI